MARLLSLGFLAALLALPLARATADDKGNVAKGDKDFVNEAATGGMLEVKLGQLAMDNASNADVKKFGERMVSDHSKANKELKDIADKKGINCPKDLEAKQQQEFDRLSKMKGADFDREYVQLMVKDHKDDVAAFENQAKNGQDKDLRNFAEKTLPTLREHLGLIQNIAGKSNK